MYAHELYEQNKPRVIVTYPGRFQPFHQGHAGVFAQLQKQFGRDSVYILTSNDTSSAKSPFNFSDKYQLMTAAGVPGDKIIETNQMYKLPDSIDAANTIFITAVGAPDADRLNPDTYTKRDQKDKEGNVTKPAGSPSYYKTWGGPETPVTADQHGYVIIIPEIHKEVTIKGKKYDVSHGTECRNLWNSIRNDAKARTEFLTQMYARPSQELAAIFDKIPQATAEDISADSQSSTSPIHGAELKQGVMEGNNQSSAKTGIYQSEVYGARAYHSKCLEKGCDWESRRYDRIKQAQDAAKKHAQTHIKSGMAEGKTVTRIDSKPITDFASSLKAYKHTDDWSQSGLDTGDDSYWKNKNLKTNTTKGLFAGDPRRTALYATGNAHETRYVEFTLDGQPIVYFDKKDLPAMRSRKTYLTVFDADNFKQLPTGEWFSQNPGTPIEQMPIGDPFKYIADQGWIVRVTDDLDKVFNQVKKMHKAGKIAQYGAEGMNESKQGVAEGFMALGPNRIRTEMNGPNAGKIVKDPESLQDMSADDFFKKYPELKQSWEQAYKQQVSNRTSAGQAAAQAAIDKRYNDLSWMTPEEQAQYKQLAAKDQATMQATDTRTYGAERYLKQLFQQKMDAKKAASMLKVHWAPLKQLESFLQGKVNNKIELSAYLAPNTESLGKTRWTSAYDPTVGIVLDGHITVGGRGDLGSDQYKMIAGQRGQQKYPSRPGQIDPTLSMDTSVHHEVLIDNWKIKEIVLPADIPPEIDRLVQQYKIPVRRLGNPQGMAEDAAGVGVVAKNKKMARDPRYSMSITKDVKPSTPKNMLRAFRLSEDSSVSEEQIISMVKSFLPLAMRELKLKKLPKIVIKKHIESHDGQATFGRFVNEEEKIYLGIADRHPVDILRTLAHELVHFKQHEQGRMEPDSGDTGSPIENEANAVAGVLMRYFNKKYPNAVKSSAVSLDESLFQRYQQFKENGDEADEIKKQKNLIPFPKGTVKVDVSDVYDWYKIGQEISDLDDADPADFGKGPPQTVMAFGSEPEEHRYLKDLKRLGLKTHDIDENFADGRNPQDKGDSKRYNVPTKGKISTLRKIAKQGGRRGQLAHWMANMRSGKNKK